MTGCFSVLFIYLFFYRKSPVRAFDCEHLFSRFGEAGWITKQCCDDATHWMLDALKEEKKVLFRHHLMAAAETDSGGSIQSAICFKHPKWIGQKHFANSSIKIHGKSFRSLSTLLHLPAVASFKWTHSFAIDVNILLVSHRWKSILIFGPHTKAQNCTLHSANLRCTE